VRKTSISKIKMAEKKQRQRQKHSNSEKAISGSVAKK
jgi:hypothetical protein